MLAENIVGVLVGELLPEAKPVGDLSQDPPIRLCLAGAGQKTTLAR